jgi:hypothetical protein
LFFLKLCDTGFNEMQAGRAEIPGRRRDSMDGSCARRVSVTLSGFWPVLERQLRERPCCLEWVYGD